jgi:hypothetical protein
MATDDTMVRLYSKKLLALADVKDRFLTYLLAQVEDAFTMAFRVDGAFDDVVPITAGDTDGCIDIGALGFVATDGLGHLISAGVADSRLTDCKVPAVNQFWRIGLMRALVEDSIEINPVNGRYEYASYKETIGKLGTPNTVTNETPGIKLKVDSLWQDGSVDHSGTIVRVWLKSWGDGGIGPKTAAPLVAFETCTVAYESGANYIHTASKLGQSTTSTTAANYVIMLQGPIIDSTDLRAVSGVFYVGGVQGVVSGPITSFDTTDQMVHVPASSIFSDVFRYDDSVGINHAKVSVKYQGAEPVSTLQIDVQPATGGQPVFSVDKEGDVVCHNIAVGGTEIVTTSEVVTGNIQIGDSSGDIMTIYSHEIHRAGSSITFGTATQNTPDSIIEWDANTGYIEYQIALSSSGGYGNYLNLKRNDAISAAGNLRVYNANAGGSRMSLEVQGDVQLGLTSNPLDADSPSFKMPTGLSVVETWEIYHEYANRRLYIKTNNASDRIVYINNTGAGYSHLQIGGNVYLEGSGTMSLKAVTADAVLGLQDGVTTSIIPLSQKITADTSPLSDRLESGATSMLGAVNEAIHGVQRLGSNGVSRLTGLTFGAPTGLSIPYIAGAVFVGGKLLKVAAGTIVVTSNQTNYIYVDGADGLVKSNTTKATAITASTVLLGIADTGPSSITSLRGARIGTGRGVQATTITVGKLDNGVTDFNTLFEALEWIRQTQSLVSTHKRPEMEIVLVGQLDLTGLGSNAVRFYPEHSGLRIRGARKSDLTSLIRNTTYDMTASGYGETRILWGNGTRLFESSTGYINDITIENVVFVYTDTVDQNAILFNHLFTSSSGLDISFKNCRFTHLDTSVGHFKSVLAVQANANVGRCLFEDCTFDRSTLTASSTAEWISVAATGFIKSLMVNRCTFSNGSSTDQTHNRDMTVYGGYITIEDCKFSYPGNGLRLYAQLMNNISRCEFNNCANVAISLMLTAGWTPRTSIKDSVINLTLATASQNRVGIDCLSNGQTSIRHNTINITSTTGGVYNTFGINIDAGEVTAEDNTISIADGSSNLVAGIYAAAMATITCNTVHPAGTGTGYRGIHLASTATKSVVIGNRVMHSSLLPGFGIYNGADYCVFSGNYLRATTPLQMGASYCLYTGLNLTVNTLV